MADRSFKTEMDKLGVELPQGEALAPSFVMTTILAGLVHDVPLLKAHGEYLD